METNAKGLIEVLRSIPGPRLLYLELDALTQLRKRAEKELITEARRVSSGAPIIAATQGAP